MKPIIAYKVVHKKYRYGSSPLDWLVIHLL